MEAKNIIFIVVLIFFGTASDTHEEARNAIFIVHFHRNLALLFLL